MSAYVDLYTALWHHAYGPERYAKRKDSPGQLSLFPHGGHDVSDQPREPDGRWTTGGNSAKDSPAPDDPPPKEATVRTEADRGSAGTEPKAEGNRVSENTVKLRVATKTSVVDGKTVTEHQPAVATVIGGAKAGHSRGGSPYLEVPESIAKGVRDGDYVLATTGNLTWAEAMKRTGGDANDAAGLMQGTSAARVTGRGKPFGGKIRLYVQTVAFEREASPKQDGDSKQTAKAETHQKKDYKTGRRIVLNPQQYDDANASAINDLMYHFDFDFEGDNLVIYDNDDTRSTIAKLGVKGIA